MLREDSKRKNGGQGQAVGHKETRKQVSVTFQTQKVNGKPSGAHPPWPCPLLPLPCCLPLVNLDLQLQLQDDPHLAAFPIWLLSVQAQYSVNLDPQGRRFSGLVLTCYLTLGKLPPLSETSEKDNGIEIEIYQVVIHHLSL